MNVRTPPKRRKRLHTQQELRMYEHWPLQVVCPTDRKKDLCCLHPLMCHNVERKIMAVYVDQLILYEGTLRVEWSGLRVGATEEVGG
jgi:hypothetical protein